MTNKHNEKKLDSFEGKEKKKRKKEKKKYCDLFTVKTFLTI